MADPAHALFDQHKAAPAAAPAAEAVTPAPSKERDPSTGRYLPAGLSPHLVRQAREAGLGDADLKEMDAEDIRQHVSEWRLEQQTERIWQRSESARESARAPSPEGPATADAPEDFRLPSQDEDPEHGFHPALAEKWNKLVARVEVLEGQVKPVVQHVQTQARQAGESFARRMEKFYAAHPETYGTFKLKGDPKADAEFHDTPEFHARMMTYAAWKKAGGDLEELEATLEQEHAKRFGHAAAPEAGEPEDEVEEWEQGVLARPTHHAAAEDAPGREKALQGLRGNPALNGSNKPKRTPPQRGAYLKHS